MWGNKECDHIFIRLGTKRTFVLSFGYKLLCEDRSPIGLIYFGMFFASVFS